MRPSALQAFLRTAVRLSAPTGPKIDPKVLAYLTPARLDARLNYALEKGQASVAWQVYHEIRQRQTTEPLSPQEYGRLVSLFHHSFQAASINPASATPDDGLLAPEPIAADVLASATENWYHIVAADAYLRPDIFKQLSLPERWAMLMALIQMDRPTDAMHLIRSTQSIKDFKRIRNPDGRPHNGLLLPSALEFALLEGLWRHGDRANMAHLLQMIDDRTRVKDNVLKDLGQLPRLFDLIRVPEKTGGLINKNIGAEISPDMAPSFIYYLTHRAKWLAAHQPKRAVRTLGRILYEYWDQIDDPELINTWIQLLGQTDFPDIMLRWYNRALGKDTLLVPEPGGTVELTPKTYEVVLNALWSHQQWKLIIRVDQDMTLRQIAPNAMVRAVVMCAIVNQSQINSPLRERFAELATLPAAGTRQVEGDWWVDPLRWVAQFLARSSRAHLAIPFFRALFGLPSYTLNPADIELVLNTPPSPDRTAIVCEHVVPVLSKTISRIEESKQAARKGQDAEDAITGSQTAGQRRKWFKNIPPTPPPALWLQVLKCLPAEDYPPSHPTVNTVVSHLETCNVRTIHPPDLHDLLTNLYDRGLPATAAKMYENLHTMAAQSELTESYQALILAATAPMLRIYARLGQEEAFRGVCMISVGPSQYAKYSDILIPGLLQFGDAGHAARVFLAIRITNPDTPEPTPEQLSVMVRGLITADSWDRVYAVLEALHQSESTSLPTVAGAVVAQLRAQFPQNAAATQWDPLVQRIVNEWSVPLTPAVRSDLVGGLLDADRAALATSVLATFHKARAPLDCATYPDLLRALVAHQQPEATIDLLNDLATITPPVLPMSIAAELTCGYVTQGCIQAFSRLTNLVLKDRLVADGPLAAAILYTELFRGAVTMRLADAALKLWIHIQKTTVGPNDHDRATPDLVSTLLHACSTLLPHHLPAFLDWIAEHQPLDQPSGTFTLADFEHIIRAYLQTEQTQEAVDVVVRLMPQAGVLPRQATLANLVNHLAQHHRVDELCRCRVFCQRVGPPLIGWYEEALRPFQAVKIRLDSIP
ncbi:hypothetical protein IWQ60_003112 [Tieghemiomyces parasiticus]|uniref:Uncharacterized protein n=1 Tax=Tieghemiomyces parasiticus TaxID=78921 RepID=A0A9W8AAZ0_9FUNG|nr:hypothetical protein IWQ60_003112 [Tieghemiomyces parasiticus]